MGLIFKRLAGVPLPRDTARLRTKPRPANSVRDQPERPVLLSPATSVRCQIVDFPIAAVLDHDSQLHEDVGGHLTGTRRDLDERSSDFDANGIAPQLILVFVEPIGEVTESIGNGVAEPGDPSHQVGPIWTPIWFPSR